MRQLTSIPAKRQTSKACRVERADAEEQLRECSSRRQRCTYTDRGGDECQDQTLMEHNGHNLPRVAPTAMRMPNSRLRCPLQSSSHAPETVSGFS